jgi:hypothetical protein
MRRWKADWLEGGKLNKPMVESPSPPNPSPERKNTSKDLVEMKKILSFVA